MTILMIKRICLHESAEGIMIWSRRRLNIGVALATEKLIVKNVQHFKTKTILNFYLVSFRFSSISIIQTNIVNKLLVNLCDQCSVIELPHSKRLKLNVCGKSPAQDFSRTRNLLMPGPDNFARV